MQIFTWRYIHTHVCRYCLPVLCPSGPRGRTFTKTRACLNTFKNHSMAKPVERRCFEFCSAKNNWNIYQRALLLRSMFDKYFSIIHSRVGPYLLCCCAFLLAVELIWIAAMVAVSRARISWCVLRMVNGNYVRYSGNYATRRQASHVLRDLIDRECDQVDELYYWFGHELFSLHTCVRFRLWDMVASMNQCK